MATYEALIEAADRGAYKAKADGRDCVREAD
jgi:PleD family two-component response regulator